MRSVRLAVLATLCAPGAFALVAQPKPTQPDVAGVPVFDEEAHKLLQRLLDRLSDTDLRLARIKAKLTAPVSVGGQK